MFKHFNSSVFSYVGAGIVIGFIIGITFGRWSGKEEVYHDAVRHSKADWIKGIDGDWYFKWR